MAVLGRDAGGLELIEGIGTGAIRDHDVGLANALRAQLGLPPSDSAIVSADVPHGAPSLPAHISGRQRAGRLRVGFHLYNTQADVDLVADHVAGQGASSPRDLRSP